MRRFCIERVDSDNGARSGVFYQHCGGEPGWGEEPEWFEAGEAAFHCRRFRERGFIVQQVSHEFSPTAEGV